MPGQPRPLPPVRRLRARLAVLCAVLLLMPLSGCGLLGGADNSSGGGSGGPGGLEQGRITLGVMPIIDVAPVHRALKMGYFKQEGLEIELKAIQGGAAGIAGLVSGDLQISFGNWVSFFAAQAKGAADLKLISDGYQAGPNGFVLMTAADSAVKAPKDLAGRSIAVNTFANVAELMTKSTLEDGGVDPKSVTFKEIAYPDMPAAIKRKDVDAGLIVEPFSTQTKRTGGVTQIADAATGAARDFPIAGYATSAQFAQKNPKTVAAFQRALAKAQADCAQRGDVELLLTEYAKLDKDTVRQVGIGVFPTTLDASRLQRVVDLMRTYGLLAQAVDVHSMIWRIEG